MLETPGCTDCNEVADLFGALTLLQYLTPNIQSILGIYYWYIVTFAADAY